MINDKPQLIRAKGSESNLLSTVAAIFALPSLDYRTFSPLY
jgi:hypothetical protein